MRNRPRWWRRWAERARRRDRAGRLGLDLVLQAVALEFDVEPIAEDLLQGLQAIEGQLLLILAQRPVDGTIGTAGQRDQALAQCFQPLDLDVGRFVLAGVEEGARGELHQVLVAARVGRQKRQGASWAGPRRAASSAHEPVGPRPVAEVDLQRAADDGLYARAGELVGELQRAEEIVGVGEAERRKPVGGRQLGQPGYGDGPFQQRIGRMHLEVDKGGLQCAFQRHEGIGTRNLVKAVEGRQRQRKAPLAVAQCCVCTSYCG